MSTESKFQTALNLMKGYRRRAEDMSDTVTSGVLQTLQEDFEHAGGDEDALRTVISERMSALIATPGIYVLQGHEDLAWKSLRAMNYVARVGHMVGADIVPVLSGMVTDSTRRREARIAATASSPVMKP